MPRPLDELLNVDDPAWPLVQEWIGAARNQVEALPPSEHAAAELESAQVTVRSPMGAIVYHTGGLLVDGGWIRILGSGHPKLPRRLMEWNRQRSFDKEGKSRGFLLVADDVLGGFFAINGGALGDDVKNIHYFAPDTLRWESLDRGYSDFITFCFQGDLDGFYGDYRWPGWREFVEKMTGDQAVFCHPPLWTREGKDTAKVYKETMPIAELYGLNVEPLPSQLGP